MIFTLNDKQDAVVLTRLITKSGKEKEIENLHDLYSTPNFELGYLQHGELWIHQEKPNEVLVTKDTIQVFDSYRWGENGIKDKSGTNNLYPVEYFTTKAKNTLIIIKQLLGLEYDSNFALKNFFVGSSKEVTSCGFLIDRKFDLLMQIKKLRYLLENQELALPLLKDAYLDFYLFADLLTKIDFEVLTINPKISLNLFEQFHEEATENTEVLILAKEFAKLKQ